MGGHLDCAQKPSRCVCVCVCVCACVCMCVCVSTASKCLVPWCGASRVVVAVAKHGAHIAWMLTISEGHGINSLIMPYSDSLSGVG